MGLRLDDAARTSQDVLRRVMSTRKRDITAAYRSLERSEPRSDCVYNLFRNTQRPELLCAVPEDRPIPAFVVAGEWSFFCPLRSSNDAPRGFNHRAAGVGVRFNGYYLFHAAQTVVSQR